MLELNTTPRQLLRETEALLLARQQQVQRRQRIIDGLVQQMELRLGSKFSRQALRVATEAAGPDDSSTIQPYQR